MSRMIAIGLVILATSTFASTVTNELKIGMSVDINDASMRRKYRVSDISCPQHLLNDQFVSDIVKIDYIAGNEPDMGRGRRYVNSAIVKNGVVVCVEHTVRFYYTKKTEFAQAVPEALAIYSTMIYLARHSSGAMPIKAIQRSKPLQIAELKLNLPEGNEKEMLAKEVELAKEALDVSVKLGIDPDITVTIQFGEYAKQISFLGRLNDTRGTCVVARCTTIDVDTIIAMSSISGNKAALDEAANDNPERQYRLGLDCYNKGGAKNIREAAKWYRKAAEQGHPEAQYALSSCYASGEGVTKDEKESIKWLRKAAEGGHAVGQVTLGLMYLGGMGVAEDAREGVKWYRMAANQGLAWAQLQLGVCYSIGKGVAENQCEAAKWYHKAAEQGDADAQHLLGACYLLGSGVEKDPKEAVKWYRMAACRGHVKAQLDLGRCYNNGDGVGRDMREAAKWYRAASAQGSTEAIVLLGDCYFNGFGLAQDKCEAVRLWRKAAEQGCCDAQYLLGVCYDYGAGVKQDGREAMNWYRKAAQQGHAEARKRLGHR